MLLLFGKFRIIKERVKGAIPMKKEKVSLHFFRYSGKPVQAKKEIPYEIRLQARLNLDVICFEYNRAKLEEAINSALETNDIKAFEELSAQYKQYLWE